jgi:thiol-disulfide isomerase/thioredoxin
MSELFKNSKVIELTPKHVNEKGYIVHSSVNNKKGMLAVVASWCGYCKLLKKEYIDTSNMLGSSFPMFYLDSDKYPDLVKKLQVNGYPTILYINRYGKLYKKYQDERSKTAFLENICKESRQCV